MQSRSNTSGSHTSEKPDGALAEGENVYYTPWAAYRGMSGMYVVITRMAATVLYILSEENSSLNNT